MPKELNVPYTLRRLVALHPEDAYYNYPKFVGRLFWIKKRRPCHDLPDYENAWTVADFEPQQTYTFYAAQFGPV